MLMAMAFGLLIPTSDSIEFKYTLDDWDNEEGLTSGGSCTKTTSGFTNRFLAISGDVLALSHGVCICRFLHCDFQSKYCEYHCRS